MIYNLNEIIESLKVKEKRLITSLEEGYLGKRVYEVLLNDGTKRRCEQITKRKDNGDAVVIIPITEMGNLIMIVESRPIVKETVAISFPAGMVDKGEDALTAAKRELFEETGYVSNNWQLIEWHYQDQGCSKAIIKTFLAEGVYKVAEQHLDGTENLKVIEVEKQELDNLMNKAYEENSLVNSANTKIAYMSLKLKRKL